MTAPDPGLTDLLAAHAVVETERRYTYPPLHSPEPFRATGSFDIVTCACGWKDDNHPAHVASIIEPTHTSFCNDGIEDGTGTAHVCHGECGEAERVAQAERIAELEADITHRKVRNTLSRMGRDDDPNTIDAWRETVMGWRDRAENAEIEAEDLKATVARVEELRVRMVARGSHEAGFVRAALEGEQ